MLSKGEAQSKLHANAITGEAVKLANGDVFIIPSLPLGSRGRVFLEYLKEFDKHQPTDPEGMDWWQNVLTQILQINYDVSAEDCDGLFSVSNMSEILARFFGQDPAAMRGGGEEAPLGSPKEKE